MPAALEPLAAGRIGPGPVLDEVDPRDTVTVVTGFVEALREGSAVVRVRASGGRTLVVHYADLRAVYGVVLRAVLDGDGDGEVGGAEAALPAAHERARPRVGVVEKDRTATIRRVDEATSVILGWEAGELVGRSSLELVHPLDHARALENWVRLLELGKGHPIRVRLRHKEGGWVWMELSNIVRPGADGEVVSCQMLDISEEMAAIEALHAREKLLRRVTETVPVGLVELAADRTVTYCNAALEALLGAHGVATPDEMVTVVPPPDWARLQEAVSTALGEGRDGDVEVRLSGSGARGDRLCQVAVRPVLDGATVLGVVLCVTDVTELRRLAATDPLTGLHNRAGVLDALELALSSNVDVGVLFVDLDGFKSVNDRLGHDAGDQLLRSAATRLRALAGAGVAGRVGGDEFVVVLPAPSSVEAVDALAREVQEALGDVEGSGCGASVGAAVVGGGSVTAEEAIARADEAMYRAKRSGRKVAARWHGDPGPPLG